MSNISTSAYLSNPASTRPVSKEIIQGTRKK